MVNSSVLSDGQASGRPIWYLVIIKVMMLSDINHSAPRCGKPSTRLVYNGSAVHSLYISLSYIFSGIMGFPPICRILPHKTPLGYRQHHPSSFA